MSENLFRADGHSRLTTTDDVCAVGGDTGDRTRASSGEPSAWLTLTTPDTEVGTFVMPSVYVPDGSRSAFGAYREWKAWVGKSVRLVLAREQDDQAARFNSGGGSSGPAWVGPAVRDECQCQPKTVSGLTKKLDQRSRPSTPANAVKIERSSGSNRGRDLGVAGRRVGGVGRGSRHLWNARVDRVAPGGRGRGGQDDRNGPRTDPRSVPTRTAHANTKHLLNTPRRTLGTQQGQRPRDDLRARKRHTCRRTAFVRATSGLCRHRGPLVAERSRRAPRPATPARARTPRGSGRRTQP